MYKVVGEATRVSDVTSLVADLETDIATLPTTYSMGSVCYVIENASVYMINSSGLWVKQSGG